MAKDGYWMMKNRDMILLILAVFINKFNVYNDCALYKFTRLNRKSPRGYAGDRED